MRCEDASTEFVARAHDESSEDDPDLIAHLERCPECRSHEDALSPVRDAWRTARETEIDPGADAWARLRDRLRQEPQVRRRSPVILALPALAAAAAILLFGLLLQPAIEEGRSVEVRYGKLLLHDTPTVPGETARWIPGQTIRNLGDSAARVDLDGTTLLLAPGSVLRWREEQRFDLREGGILVRTARPLRIDAGGASVDVLGTEFAMERSGHGVTVHVLRGRVRLSGGGAEETLTTGTRAYCAEGATPTTPERASPWPALGWLGEPRIRFRPLPTDPTADLEFEILLETDSRETIPIRPFTHGTGDFLLEITDPDGRRFPLKILPAMIVERTRPPGHRADYPLVRGRPYELRLRVAQTAFGDRPGTYSVSASYNVRGRAGDTLWQGRLASEASTIRR